MEKIDPSEVTLLSIVVIPDAPLLGPHSTGYVGWS